MRLLWLAVLAVVAVLLLVPAEAEAHDPSQARCTGNHEYRHIRDGQTMREVRRNVDFRGRVVSRRSGITVKRYPMCAATGFTAADVYYVSTGVGRLVFDKERW